MVDLRANPYYLSDEDIAWVEQTIASMTDEEKVGQLFFLMTAGMKPDHLKELVQKYHCGGIRYNNMPSQYVLEQSSIIYYMDKGTGNWTELQKLHGTENRVLVE